MSKQEGKAESEESNRMWASASFVGVLIIIGLPLWWKTTEVYRVTLPYDKISEFASLPSTVGAELTVLANDEHTAAEIASVLKKAFEDEEIIRLKIKRAVLPADLHRTMEAAADEQDAVEDLAAKYDLEQHNAFYVVQRRPLAEDVWLGNERVMFFRDIKASPALAQALKHWVYQTSVVRGARSDVADSARRTRFPPGGAYHVVLSVAQPKPDQLSVHFDAREAVEDYIGSFVDELSVLHNFTLKSQWLYLLDFDFKAKEVKDSTAWGRHYSVSQERLQLLLTRLEERAATHVSPLPTLNLALYAAPCAAAPLLIRDHNDQPVNSPVQAFMSPKWGGVVLGSPSEAECRQERPTWTPNVKLVMGTFVAQLRKLLGIADAAFMSPKWGGVVLGSPSEAECRQERPAWTPNVKLVMGTFVAQLRKLLGIADAPPVPGAFLQPLRSVTPRRWEVDALLRIRTVEQLVSAQRTLQSLAQLLGEISNIVINDEVGASINAAVDYIQQASDLAARGALAEAYRASLKAHDAAEAAFMEPSLLALLYFPDDQKYAIYIPLFLPIMFPVVLSLKNLLLWFRGKPVHKEKAE